MSQVVTHIATSDEKSVTVRGKDLCDEIIGERTFTEMIYFLSVGRMPSTAEARVLDACLVTLMEHGWVPTSIVTRLVADSVPDDVQVAMAAGLLSVGPVFAGTMEGCAEILAEGIRSGEDPDVYCKRVAEEYVGAKRPVPGFGHRLHKPDDPRSIKLLRVAEENGLEGRYVDLLLTLSREVDAARGGRHLTINATGMIAALFLEIGIPLKAGRGMAVVSRAGGLLGHVVEEFNEPSARKIWQLTREGIPYSAPEETQA
ncbi:citryl-CoA lyase [Rhodococcus sp. HM1]|uniref:citryl-CoA lyase n=1 Tax=unclassified Rhodococcus (in: high G+C Gram-positive bacteria) TaxID=192944 RepID=UPI0018CDA7F2|nr:MULTISPECIES: citryl-CoA lyase [unclassified Rhodococcus (in: high G+C Gram-positive bacteria)]MBH0122189.1 citryl-CoA lyase [Rhodococcus sp. CX]MCK8669956.1 citryl-CoA lyase [Rhodococcus sp. HM1]